MKKAKRGRARRPSTALVVRHARTIPRRAEPAMTLQVLSSDPLITAAFIGTLKLSEKQILALRRPVDAREIEWRAAEKDGPAIIPYLSHNGYRDRLDAAFGLGGWGMMPVGQPKQLGDSFVYVPYALVIGGVPRVYAWGEQQIHKMTYGDALEGAKSNAITRCGKELGIARELWNRTHVAELKARKGAVVADGQTRASDPRAAEPITQPQRQRLALIFKHSGRTDLEVKGWLKACYGIEASKLITRRDYQAICVAIERPGPLPMPEREPGEEG